MGEAAEGVCPYRDLYIYYLEGRAPSRPGGWGKEFLGNWQEDDWSFLFFDRPADGQVEALVRRDSGLRLLDRYRMTYEEWQGDAPAVLEVGRFRIAPPWQPLTAGRGSLDIRIDPGVVFGSGGHPTTRDCLDMLGRVCRAPAPDTVLDLGTGSGVLALAAARAGCRRVLAVDFNRLAVRTAGGNIRRNRLSKRVLAVQGRAEDFITLPADLVVANIHWDVARKLISTAGWRQKKWFILSGLLRSEAREAVDRLVGHRCRILATRQRNGVWHTILGTSA